MAPSPFHGLLLAVLLAHSEAKTTLRGTARKVIGFGIGLDAIDLLPFWAILQTTTGNCEIWKHCEFNSIWGSR